MQFKAPLQFISVAWWENELQAQCKVQYIIEQNETYQTVVMNPSQELVCGVLTEKMLRLQP